MGVVAFIVLMLAELGFLLSCLAGLARSLPRPMLPCQEQYALLPRLFSRCFR
jgi:hypothetical protein